MTETWKAPDVDRTSPDRLTDERASLDQWVDFQRATLLMKCAGLTAEQLKARAVPPSSLSLLGLVRHMVEVERWWFTAHAGETPFVYEYCTDDNEEADFNDLDDADAAADLETFRRECEASRAAVAGKSLDHVIPSQGHEPGRTANIRWIYVHMIEEYARHNGHADLLREAIDGTTGD